MITVQCPAKVNLTLKIKGKRPDGFHEIESVMQTIGLYDYLTVNVSPSETTEIKLSGNNTEIPYDERNLVYKAAKLFLENLKERAILDIYIEKNIPVAAGLAGGSTDAAGTLFALNELFNRPFSKSQLHEMCASLGSDLNVCLEGGRLLCKGRGEIIEPLEYEGFNLSLIKPKNLGISAKEAYGKFAKKNINNCPLTPTPSPAGRGEYMNDLEWAIIDNYPELQKIKELYPNSMMSGSGSTYFMLDGQFEKLEGYETFNNLKSENEGICIVKRS